MIGSRQPAADPRGTRAGSRYDWLACGTPLSCRWRRRSHICYQNGVDVYSVSNEAIGFLFFWNWKLS